MKFLMMIKHAEGAPGLEHPQSLHEAMGKFVEESFKSGVLKETAGLKPTSAATKIRSKGGKLTVTDGPFAESKETLIGYWIVDVVDEARALELTSKVVAFIKAPVEVRQVGERPPEV